MRVLAGTYSTAEVVPSPSAAAEVDPDKDLRVWVQWVCWIVAGLFAALATALSLLQIRGHLNSFSKPSLQRKIVGILWIVPIYAVNSWISLRFMGISVYVDMVRDCYEAYVLHLFLSLMVSFLCHPDGNRVRLDSVLEGLDDDHKVLPHMFPFTCIFNPWPVDHVFLQICYRGTLQFCFLKPLTTFAAVVMEMNGVYNEGSFHFGSGYIYVSFVMNCSITYAAYCLVQFYLAFKKELTPHGPVPKFLCIKAILFLSFWQSVVLAGLSKLNLIHEIGRYTAADVKTGINNLLLCLEMVLIAWAHRYAFPYRMFEDTSEKKHGVQADDWANELGGGGAAKESTSGVGGDSLERSLLSDNFALSDTLRDINEAGMGSLVVPTGFKPSSRASAREAAQLPAARDIGGGGAVKQDAVLSEDNSDAFRL